MFCLYISATVFQVTSPLPSEPNPDVILFLLPWQIIKERPLVFNLRFMTEKIVMEVKLTIDIYHNNLFHSLWPARQ